MVDCTGSRAGIKTAINIVKPRGTVVVKTTVANKGDIDLNRIVVNEITLIGSRCGPFPAAIKAIRTGKVVLSPLISRTFLLEDGIEAFQYASGRGSMKVVIKV